MLSLGIVLAVAFAFVAGDEAAQDHKFISDVSKGVYQFGNPPPGLTNVKTWIYVTGVMVYESKPIFAAEIYMGMKWNDSRLAHDGSHTIPYHLSNHIWKPDLFFKESVKVDSPDYPSKASYTKVNSSGGVICSMRLFSKTICRDLVSKKTDITCSLTFELYGTTADRADISGIKLLNPSFDSIFIPGWKMTMVDVIDCQKTYPTGTFSCKKIVFKMKKVKGDDSQSNESNGSNESTSDD